MKLARIFLALIALTACIDQSTAVKYAERAHPECTGFLATKHHNSMSGDEPSLTEVAMKCGAVDRSITIKCVFGLGCVSDTVCYENN